MHNSFLFDLSFHYTIYYKDKFYDKIISNWNISSIIIFQAEKDIHMLPQACLLCDAQLEGPSLLAAHVYETHGIDMAQILSSEPVMERKKKLPNLVKITDLKSRTDKENQGKIRVGFSEFIHEKLLQYLLSYLF